MACSSHVEKGDVVAVSVAVEQLVPDGKWAINMTRGTVLQGTKIGKNLYVLTMFICISCIFIFCS